MSGRQLSFTYEHRKIMLEETTVTRNLVGKSVDTYAFPDGRFEVRWKGLPLTYSVFDKDQRVGHAAVTENKRLGAVLAQIQDLQRAPEPSRNPPPVGKQATRCQKIGRRNLEGWNSKLARRQAARDAEAIRAAGQASDP